jgi:hypothetical protein
VVEGTYAAVAYRRACHGRTNDWMLEAAYKFYDLYLLYLSLAGDLRD